MCPRFVAGPLVFAIAATLACRPASAQVIRVKAAPGAEANSFVPEEALGAGIDRLSADAVEKQFTPEVVQKVLSAGWQTVSYRQNTELHVEAWHWNPQGTWSEPDNKGYFTGNATPTQLI